MGAFVGTFRVINCEPAVIVNGGGGEIVAPAGRPVTLIVTAPVNPFSAVTETCVVNAPPGGNDAELVKTENAKSGEGGGGGGGPEDPPPPQLEIPAARVTSANMRPNARSFDRREHCAGK